MRFLIPLLVLMSCGPDRPAPEAPASIRAADVVSVEVAQGTEGYRFTVAVRSPDTGCDRYADWWEVVSEAGELIYRRPLSHSHVDEQPFVRSGAPVRIGAETVVWVRAHMHPTGYGGVAFRGSVGGGFRPQEPPADFAADLAVQPPGPPACRW